MSFNYTVSYNIKREVAQAGTHTAKIESWQKKEYTDMEGITYENILFTWITDNNEISWDTIFQRINQEGTFLVYDEFKMNRYSQALEIPEGTEFKSIDEWANYLVGRLAEIVIEERKERLYITEVRKHDDEPF